MIPEKIYRDQDGCVFETFDEAHAQSVESAASELRRGLKHEQGEYVANGSDLIENEAEIKRLITDLTKALKGSLVTEYTLNK